MPPTASLAAHEAVERIQTGPFGTQLGASEYVEQGVPVISVSEIREGHISISSRTPRVSQETVNRLPLFALSSRDVVIARKGAVDRSSWVRADYGDLFIGSDAIVVRFTSSKDARFYSYALQGQSSREWLLRHAAGSTMKSLSGAVLGALPLPVIAPSSRRRVVEVLGALDDKIAANRAVLRLTTSLVDALFAGVPRVEAGAVFDDVATIGGGGTPSTKEAAYWGGAVSWLTPTDVTALGGAWIDSTSRAITPAGLNACASALYPAGSLMMTSRATIGALAVNGQPMAVNQGFIVLQPNDESLRWWLWAQLRSRTDEFVSWANGATFLELSRGTFRKLPVSMATPDALAAFDLQASALMARHHAAQLENAALAATRDELLPLLMSGRITVKDAEKTVEGMV